MGGSSNLETPGGQTGPFSGQTAWGEKSPTSSDQVVLNLAAFTNYLESLKKKKKPVCRFHPSPIESKSSGGEGLIICTF